MIDEYPVSLTEQKQINQENDTDVLSHPLDGPYRSGAGRGLLSFGSSRLSKSPTLQDIKVFYLMFYGRLGEDEREAWADPLRMEVLKNVQVPGYRWCLSFVGDVPDASTRTGYLPIEEDFQRHFYQEHNLNFISVMSTERFRKERPRLFIEVPSQQLESVVARYWSRAWPSYTIQGYLLPENRIDILKGWDKQVRDEHLFRKVIDESFLVFYTFPDENRHFAFLSNKLSFVELEALVKIRELQNMASIIKRSQS